jgi:hypothetical protein
MWSPYVCAVRPSGLAVIHSGTTQCEQPLSCTREDLSSGHPGGPVQLVQLSADRENCAHYTRCGSQAGEVSMILKITRVDMGVLLECIHAETV